MEIRVPNNRFKRILGLSQNLNVVVLNQFARNIYYLNKLRRRLGSD